MEHDMDYKELMIKLGYEFSNIKLLSQALTHSSYTNESGLERIHCNERLEFLGDALLEMIISRILYHRTPALTEGEMTKLRADLVCEKSLYARAQELDLGSFLSLGHGELSSGGRSRPSILADAFEALIAAICLDGGLDCAVGFVERSFSDCADKRVKTAGDYKSMLQEYIQNNHGMTHKYRLVSQDGPDHNKTFTAEVLVNGEPKGTGKGKTKKAAEQAAAEQALNLLGGQ